MLFVQFLLSGTCESNARVWYRSCQHLGIIVVVTSENISGCGGVLLIVEVQLCLGLI